MTHAVAILFTWLCVVAAVTVYALHPTPMTATLVALTSLGTGFWMGRSRV